MNVLIVPWLTIDEELEEFAVRSLLRCDCINSPSLRDPALLLLVCESCTQKRPSVYFFSCASVKVRHVSLQQSLLDSGDTQVLAPPLWWHHHCIPVCSFQAEHIRDDIKRVVSHYSIRANRYGSLQSGDVVISSVLTTKTERQEPVIEQINRFNQFLHSLQRCDWEYRESFQGK